MLLNRKSRLALTVVSDQRVPGHKIVVREKPSKNSRWQVQVLGSNYCRFRNIGTEKWLGSEEVSLPEFSRRTIAQAVPTVDADWELRPMGNGLVVVLYPGTDLCMGPWRGKTGSGYGIQLYAFDPELSHLQWQIVPPSAKN